jgi:hypothetical protein
MARRNNEKAPMLQLHQPPLAQPATPPVKPERRALLRHPCQQDSICSSITSPEQEPWSATWYNLTIDGLSFAANHRFQEDEVLALELQPPIEGFRRRIFVKVVNVKAKADGLWVFGCRFVDKLTDYEMAALL